MISALRAIWTFNCWYAHQNYHGWPERLSTTLGINHLMPLWQLWSLLGLAAWAAIHERKAFAALALGAWFAATFTGPFRHYYIICIPVACLGAGLARRTLPRALLLAALLIVGAREYFQYKLPLEELSVLIHDNEEFVQARRLADQLAHTEHGPIYVWGGCPQIYKQSGLRPATRLVWHSAMVNGPLTNELHAQVLGDLLSVRPRTIIVTGWQRPPCCSDPVFAWINDHYDIVSNFWSFIICKRSDLQRREITQ